MPGISTSTRSPDCPTTTELPSVADMPLPTREEFTTEALAEGFDEVLERQWAPLTIVETHTHPFALKAIVVQGEMWLTVDEHTRHLRPGDLFSLEVAVEHAERYGQDGATYWVARKL